jgi:ABC-2 type transport system ATP-binding protein
MEEAEYLCDEIAIMDSGKIIAQGPPDDLVKTHCGGVTVRFAKKHLNVSNASVSLAHPQLQNWVEIHTRDLNQCIKELIARGVDLADMTVRTPNLEDVFLHLTGRQLRE